MLLIDVVSAVINFIARVISAEGQNWA